ncbi:MAG: metallophosphoesterase [Gammaproteobacteria bacterium]
MNLPSGYDIIGDIHGQADALQALLKKLGYYDWGGVWRYPGGARQAIFVGDYIDRNANARQVLDIVRRMTESGEALAVMGNHEFDAVAYHTPDPEHPGEYLRPHSEKEREQHHVFLEEVENSKTEHDAAIAWFRSLPMWLDLGELRVVHASWVARYREVIEREAAPDVHLSDALLVKANRKGSEECEAVECLLKGLNVRMPKGVVCRDNYGRFRTRARARWWLNETPKLLSDAIVASPAMMRQIADVPWSGTWPADAGYAEDAPPVFIGHYWQDGEPEPLADNVACVDYSAAKAGKQLVAYRWDGALRLRKSYFVSVPT